MNFTEFENIFAIDFLTDPRVTDDLFESKIVVIHSYCGRGGVAGLGIRVKFKKKENRNATE